jgi:hypothetical protein
MAAAARSAQDLAVSCADLEGTTPGELMSQRVVQAAVELTTFVLPPEFGLLAAAMLGFGKSLPVPPGDANLFRPALTEHFPSSAGLADIWASVAEVESFQSIRPQYVLACVKAAGRGQASRGLEAACGQALRVGSVSCAGSSLSLWLGGHMPRPVPSAAGPATSTARRSTTVPIGRWCGRRLLAGLVRAEP